MSRAARSARQPPRPNRLAVSAGFKRLVLDNLRDIGDVTDRAMFGGIGLYCRGCFFGIIAADVLYFKVNDSSRGAYEQRGMNPFKPFPSRPASVNYFEVPPDVVESPFDLAEWARRAIEAAMPAGAEHPLAAPKRKRRSSLLRGGD
jgi:DNA transformation protein and related proteins